MSWIPFILLSLLAAAIVVFPLIRKTPVTKSREDYDLEVYRDQIKELEQDKQSGLLSDEQEESARLEIDRRLLGVSKSGYKSPGKLPLWQTAIILAITVPLISISLYVWKGSPEIPGQPLSSRVELIQPIESREILSVIAEQRSAIVENPNDPNAWILLGRAYLVTGRFDDAVDSFERAIVLGKNDADTQMELVEALLNKSGGEITAGVKRSLSAALLSDPLHPAARFYNGIASLQDGQPQEALDIWLALAADTPPDAPWIEVLRNQIDSVALELGVEVESFLPKSTTNPNNDIAAMNPEEQMAMIENMVAQLAARLEDNPDDPEGWLRLSQSYQVLGQNDDALYAINRASQLIPDDSEILLRQAILLMSSTPPESTFPEKITTNLNHVLEVRPRDVEALYYAGIVANADGDKARARSLWLRLLDLLDPNGEAYKELQEMVKSLDNN